MPYVGKTFLRAGRAPLLTFIFIVSSSGRCVGLRQDGSAIPMRMRTGGAAHVKAVSPQPAFERSPSSRNAPVVLARSLWACEVSLSEVPLSVIGAGDGPNDELYRVVGAFWSEDGRVVVVNSGTSELRFYRRDGQFEFAKGRSGGGPGEFSTLSGAWQVNDSIIAAFDGVQRRVSLFSLQGEFLTSSLLQLESGVRWPYVVGLLDSALLAINGQVFEAGQMGVGIVRPPFVFLRFGLGGSLIDTILAVPGREFFVPNEAAQITTRALPFGRTVEFAIGSAALYYGETGRNEILMLVPGNQPRPVVRIPARRRRVTSRDIRIFKDRERERARTPAEVARVRSLDNVPFPSVFPQFDRLFVDADSNVWVRTYEYPGDGNREWLVYRGGTQIACRALLPPRTIPLQVRDGRLLALSRTDDDIEQVRVYQVRTSTR